MPERPVSRDSIVGELAKILGSALFENSGRSRTLLTFVVEESVGGRADRLKEYTIGTEALGRRDSFDPRIDTIVRAEASRLRVRLERYYATEGQADPIAIVLPKGSYAPQFFERNGEEKSVSESTPADSQPDGLLWRKFVWPTVVALAALSAFGIGTLVWRPSEPPTESSLVQFDVELRSGGALGGEVGTAVVVSPDGTRVVFVSTGQDGVARLNTRRLDQSRGAEMPGTEGARGPFFSPDSRWVGFWASGKLKKTAVSGGSPVVLGDAEGSLGASWGEDGEIIASLGQRTLSRFAASGGPPSVVLDLTKESASPMWPQMLPGEKQVLFTNVGFSGPDHANIEMLSLATGKRSVLVRGGTFGRYLPNGYVTYVNQGTLFALPVNPARTEVRGSPVPVVEGISYSSTFGFAEVDFSKTGVLVYRKNSGGEFTVQWLDSAGNSEPLLGMPGRYLWPGLSPSGKRLAVSVIESGESRVGIFEGKAGRITLVPSSAGRSLPIWTPDGRYLLLGGSGGMDWLAVDGGGTPKPLTRTSAVQIPWSLTRDGTRLAYHELGGPTGLDIWTVPIYASADGLTAGKPEPFLRTSAFETYPTFSPDGNWIAYGSNESGNWEVFVKAFPDDGKKVQISIAGGRIARWSPNGRELFYRTDDQRIMVASYTIRSGAFSVHSVRQWTLRRLADTGVLSNFDLAPDGQSIVALMPAVKPDEQLAENHVTFMLNFLDEVRRRVPVDRK